MLLCCLNRAGFAVPPVKLPMIASTHVQKATWRKVHITLNVHMHKFKTGTMCYMLPRPWWSNTAYKGQHGSGTLSFYTYLEQCMMCMLQELLIILVVWSKAFGQIWSTTKLQGTDENISTMPKEFNFPIYTLKLHSWSQKVPAIHFYAGTPIVSIHLQADFPLLYLCLLSD